MSKVDISDIGVYDLQVLLALQQKHSHGYELLKSLSLHGKKSTAGTLYPSLQKLQKKKLIRVESRGQRDKKTYQLTEKGKKALKLAGAAFCETFSDVFHVFACGKCNHS
ncbi:MAG: PadR family transcriptional regulator [Candidatus Diapherotrites archaeon]